MATDRLINSTQGDSIIAALQALQERGLSADQSASLVNAVQGAAPYDYGPALAGLIAAVNGIAIALQGTPGTPVPGSISLASLEITEPPDKSAYVDGEHFDPGGMVVTAIYSNGASRVVTGYSVEPETLTESTAAVTVRFTEDGVTRSASVPVTVDTYILRTAAGDPAVFSGAAAGIPVKDLTVDIGPGLAGWSAASIARSGKNLFDGGRRTEGSLSGRNFDYGCFYRGMTSLDSYSPGNVSYYLVTADSVSVGTSSSGYAIVFPFPCQPGQVYTLSATPSAATAYVAFFSFYNASGRYLSYGEDHIGRVAGQMFCTVTVPDNAATMLIGFTAHPSVGTVTFTDIQLELGAEATAYEPYTGSDTWTVPFGGAGPVYGGVLDVTGGVLTVTHGHIASYAGETVLEGWISSTGALSDGAEVVYPLAEPAAYRLTAVEITSLAGTNRVAADCGPVSVTYRAEEE